MISTVSRFLAPLSFALALALAAGCDTASGPAPSGPVTVVFKHGKVVGDPAPIQKLIEKFNRENPGIKVVEETLPAATDEQHQFYVINLEGGSADFDVFALDVIWGPEFARAGWLRDITGLMPQAEREEFFDAPIESVTYKGRMYAIPWYIDAGVLYYRKDLLEKHGYAGPPAAWDELASAAAKITAAEPEVKYGFVWQGKQYEGLVCNVLEYMWSAGGGVMKNGKPALDSPENVKALSFMRSLIYEKGVTPEFVNTATEEPSRLIFGRGEAVFMRNWPYAWNIYARPDSAVRGKVGLAPLPRFEGGKSASTLGGWQLGVNRFSKNPEAAEKFAKFLTSYESQKLVSTTIGFRPTRKALYSDRELLDAQPYMADLYEVFENARPRPVTPGYVAMSQALQPEFSAVLANVKTPEEALRDAQGRMAPILEAYE